MKKILPLLLLLMGCELPPSRVPSCEEHQEMQRTLDAYVDLYATEITEEDIACIHDFNIGFIDPSDHPRWCGSVAACYEADNSTIWINKFYWEAKHPEYQMLALRHESLHHIFKCLTGRVDGSHGHDAWVYGRYELGIPYWCREWDTTYICEE